ncbi:MAG: hypothetical protein H7240_01040 [Glaciimonas sp.]|nr:hypothetical protein [Glaciimonas sp.]
MLQCADADEEMAATLVYGLQQTATAVGWIIIALADMPFISKSVRLWRYKPRWCKVRISHASLQSSPG